MCQVHHHGGSRDRTEQVHVARLRIWAVLWVLRPWLVAWHVEMLHARATAPRPDTPRTTSTWAASPTSPGANSPSALSTALNSCATWRISRPTSRTCCRSPGSTPGLGTGTVPRGAQYRLKLRCLSLDILAFGIETSPLVLYQQLCMSCAHVHVCRYIGYLPWYLHAPAVRLAFF
eukprot:SAG31_NODE_2069_length_6520_cov_9.531226_2_plen_175_part_00